MFKGFNWYPDYPKATGTSLQLDTDHQNLQPGLGQPLPSEQTFQALKAPNRAVVTEDSSFVVPVDEGSDADVLYDDKDGCDHQMAEVRGIELFS